MSPASPDTPSVAPSDPAPPSLAGPGLRILLLVIVASGVGIGLWLPGLFRERGERVAIEGLAEIHRNQDRLVVAGPDFINVSRGLDRLPFVPMLPDQMSLDALELEGARYGFVELEPAAVSVWLDGAGTRRTLVECRLVGGTRPFVGLRAEYRGCRIGTWAEGERLYAWIESVREPTESTSESATPSSPTDDR